KYGTAIIKKVILYPQKSGRFSLDPMAGQVTIKLMGFDVSLYDDNTDVQNLTSNTLALNVVDLPENGKPNNFTGLVGDYTIKANLDRTNASTNDALIYKISIRGEGNLMQLQAPKLNLPEGVEGYEPKVSDKGNERTFEYSLIPQKEGKFTLPKQEISFYNASEKRYLTISSNEISFNITKGKNSNQKEDAVADGDSFSTIPAWQKGVLWASGVLLLAIFAGAVIFRKKNNSENTNISQRDSEEDFRKGMDVYARLIPVKSHLENENPKDFYPELLRVINDFIHDKTGLDLASSNKEAIHSILSQRSIPDFYILRLISIIEDCEMANYAGFSSAGNLQEIYNNTIEILVELDKRLG
ncbi:MAG: BatD family protein, partial [Bacteroidetes bacterium]|nr:BatD family protein [Bacteroidota bacterium]